MALEDRCSPPGAQSPTGIPQSPSASSSPIYHHHNHNSHNTTTTKSIFLHESHCSPSEMEMSPRVSKIELPSPISSPPPQHSSNIQHHDGYTMKFKEELNNSRHSHNDEEDNEIGNNSVRDDDDDEETSRDGNGSMATPAAITFSICNILSENFGKSKHKIRKSITATKKDVLFRPYDISGSGSETRKPQSNYFNAVDYSNRQKQLFDENIFKLSAVSYPKIHEEVYNRKYGEKIQPLGALSKTISQIGQVSPTSPITTAAIQQRNTFSPKSETGSVFSGSSSQLPLQRNDSGVESSDDTRSESGSTKDENGQIWPAWVFCTRYSDRPSSGPRYRRPKQPKDKSSVDDKRPRTAFSSEQLARLKQEFTENRYLTERRRQQLSADLGLNEAQIKIWFQNKRAKIKKTSGQKNPLAMQLMAQGLYNHTTVPLTPEEEELELRMMGKL